MRSWGFPGVFHNGHPEHLDNSHINKTLGAPSFVRFCTKGGRPRVSISIETARSKPLWISTRFLNVPMQMKRPSLSGWAFLPTVRISLLGNHIDSMVAVRNGDQRGGV